MKPYVIFLSDAGTNEQRATVVVPDQNELPKAVQTAVQTFISASGDDLCFPLFIDIHPASQFEHVEWMHRNRVPNAPVLAG